MGLPTALEVEFSLAIRAAANAFTRYRAAVVRGVYGVGPSEGTALGELHLHGDTLTPTELARRLGLTAAATTEVLDRLERAGHVRRGPHPRDRRKILITLEPETAALIEREAPAFARTLAPALHGLDEPSQRLVLRAITYATDLLQAGTAHLGR